MVINNNTNFIIIKYLQRSAGRCSMADAAGVGGKSSVGESNNGVICKVF